MHPMGERGSTVISVRLPEEMVRELNSIAEMEGCSRAGIIRDALLNYLKEHAHCLLAEERSREKDDSATHDRLMGGEHEE